MGFSDQALYSYSLMSLFLATPLSFISLQFLSAPYGKHKRPGWGPSLYPPLAWFLMEGPTLWLSLVLFPLGRNRCEPKALTLIAPFLIHYIHRTLVYPLHLHLRNRNFLARKTASGKTTSRETSRGFPVTIAAMAFAYNVWNSYLQSRWVSHYAEFESNEWFWLRFLFGMAIFITGMVVNVWADLVLLGLKGEGGNYRVPRGGLFELVSCPNYLGEVVEWLGWGVMTWSWAGLGFFLFTFANLVPRAHSHHKWYLEKFGEDYPKMRKAVIPFLY